MRRHVVLLAFGFGIAVRAAGADGSTPAAAPDFVVCPPATFANCTQAKCSPQSDGYSCQCVLDDRYSATASSPGCVAATATTVQSRYHPIDSYQPCANSGTDSPDWAWCLGFSCAIDANGKTATCACTKPPVPPFPYVVTTATFLPDGCKSKASGEVWSSATPDGVAQITAFLQQQPGHQDLKPPIVVTGPDQR